MATRESDFKFHEIWPIPPKFGHSAAFAIKVIFQPKMDLWSLWNSLGEIITHFNTEDESWVTIPRKQTCRTFESLFSDIWQILFVCSISSLSEIDVYRKLRFNWICYNKNNFVTSNLFCENVRGIWKCSRSTVWTCSIVKFLFTQHWNWWYCQFHFF